MWQNWINAILGLWVILSPFMGMSATSMTTNLVVVGAIVSVLGFWGAYSASRQYDEEYREHMHA